MVEQTPAMPRVFAVDDIGACKHADGSQREIGQIANRRSDDVEPRQERLTQCVVKTRQQTPTQRLYIKRVRFVLASLPIFRQAVTPRCGNRRLIFGSLAACLCWC